MRYIVEERATYKEGVCLPREGFLFSTESRIERSQLWELTSTTVYSQIRRYN